MTPISMISILASIIVFVMWAFSMFRTLVALRRRAVEHTGKT
jgi:hypothetical protein